MPTTASLARECLQQGIDAYERGDLPKAWEYLHKALSLSSSAHDKRGIATAGRRLASLKAEHADINGAITLCRQAKRAAEEGWCRIEMAECDHMLGTLLCRDEKYADGIRRLQRAVDMWGELGSVDGQLRSWKEIGDAMGRHGDTHGAIDAWQRCLLVYRKRDDAEGQANCHAALADCWFRLDQPDQAVKHALAALGRHRHIGSVRTSADLQLLLRLKEHLGVMMFDHTVSKLLDQRGKEVVFGLMDAEAVRKAAEASRRGVKAQRFADPRPRTQRQPISPALIPPQSRPTNPRKSSPIANQTHDNGQPPHAVMTPRPIAPVVSTPSPTHEAVATPAPAPLSVDSDPPTEDPTPLIPTSVADIPLPTPAIDHHHEPLPFDPDWDSDDTIVFSRRAQIRLTFRRAIQRLANELDCSPELVLTQLFLALITALFAAVFALALLS